MQDHEYMYEVCLCSVLEDRLHIETLFTGFKVTEREAVCVWYGLIHDSTEVLQTENLNHREQNNTLQNLIGLKRTTVHVTPDTHWSALSPASCHPPVRLN
ncbi:hypothetical protein E3U43_002988 [Larimichthys crocea]|uniref:Uncharacterized protein n=1 Tax=Larimichthys crocea TaxID=215358 RepID=A0ACD3QTZ5_LARCR|nr:hypothetical protein E3U43_002988 [Larimichthys crocea]